MADDQNEPPGGADPPYTRSPDRVPVEVLRAFAEEQARMHGYRALGDRWNLGHETLRKFATGRTAQPHARQRELIGAGFLEVNPAGYVRVGDEEGRPRALRPLRQQLPPDRARAVEVLHRIFALAERHPDELPDEAAAVRAWLLRVLNAEFDADARHPVARPPVPPEEVGDW